MENNFSSTTILSLAGAIVAIAGFFNVVLNAEMVGKGLELGIAAFYAVSNLIIYIHRLRRGDVNPIGMIKKA